MITKMIKGAVLTSLLISVSQAGVLKTNNIPDVPQLSMYGMKAVAYEQAKDADVNKIYAMNSSKKGVHGFVAYSSLKNKNFIIGNNMKILNKAGQNVFSLSKQNIQNILKDEAFHIGNGAKEFVLFTDPECPYCQQFENKIKNLKPNIKLHVLFYPLSFHRDSMKMTSWILSAPKNERAGRLVSIAKGKSNWKSYTGPIKVKEIEKSVLDGLRFGVHGTPSLFNIKGNPVKPAMFLRKAIVSKPATSIPSNVVKYLFSKNIPILLNEKSKSKKSIIAFIDIANEKSIKMMTSDYFKQLVLNNKVYIVFSPKTTVSLIESLDIVSRKNNNKKLEVLDQYLRGKTPSKKRIEELDKKASSSQIKTDIMNLKMMSHINAQFNIKQSPFIISEDGKIIK